MNEFYAMAIALGLGLLVGFQREWSASHVAGIRSFALITVLGAVMTMLSPALGPWVVPAGLIGVTAMLVIAGLQHWIKEQGGTGLTTAVAALVMYGVGAMLMLGHTAMALAIGGGVAVLLQWKQPLKNIVHRIGEADIRAIFQLVLIGLVVLPVLPDKVVGPYQVLNPFKIWLLVVLIVGISLCGYMVFKFLGARVGVLLGGLLGGVISSTATTVGYAKHTRGRHDMAGLACVVLMIASTVVFVRVLLEVALVAPSILPQLMMPLLAMTGVMAVLSAMSYALWSRTITDAPLPEDPAQLKTAIVFGLLYALVLLGVAAAKSHLGNTGLYVVAGISGLTDMDAITLSTAQMVHAGRVMPDTGWRLILVGFMANLIFKALMVASLGSKALLWRVSLMFALAIAAGTGLILFWPAL
ncbi:MAG: MgtC/SapB family protein [Phycisphaeraceae bacterium]|nr:MgtC/SapB family protein [Phycisphaeraceae bacterium]